MSLILDQFPSMSAAEAFVADAKARFDLDGTTEPPVAAQIDVDSVNAGLGGSV